MSVLITTLPAFSNITVTFDPSAVCTWPWPHSGLPGWRTQAPGSNSDRGTAERGTAERGTANRGTANRSMATGGERLQHVRRRRRHRVERRVERQMDGAGQQAEWAGAAAIDRVAEDRVADQGAMRA